MTTAHEAFISAVSQSMGLGAAVRAPGTTVVAASARANSNVVVAYAIAEHTVLWCDPALADSLAPMVDTDRAAPLDECDAFLAALGWTPLPRAQMQVLGPEGVRPPSRSEHLVQSVEVTNPADQALLDTFRATLTAEDRDNADLDDSPDEHIVVVLDADGVAAYSSQAPFAPATQFADISVATRPDVRGRGLGHLVVARLCDEIAARGLHPLYRRDVTNVRSVRLCTALGFVPAIEVSGFRRP
ncbi:MAG: GNAT family N-acetyltransferase [Actinobacteria bacterium]|nr:MAG: GNAT family N-acetyltransferase [Actinomycetota bacterium]